MSQVEWRFIEERVWVLLERDTSMGSEQAVSWEAAYYPGKNDAWYVNEPSYGKITPYGWPVELKTTQQKLKYIETLWRMGAP